MSLDAVDLEVLRLVEAACRTVGVPWMLVGALARDVHLVEMAGVPSGRATIDVDVAVAVESWSAFNELKNLLINSGNFAADRNAHRVLGIADELVGRQLDIMPFGRGIEGPRAVIRWPSDITMVMSVAGFAEVLASSIEHRVGDQRMTRLGPWIGHPQTRCMERSGHHDRQRCRRLLSTAHHIRARRRSRRSVRRAP